ncbi:FAD-binding oxidoreductase [Rhodopirellula sp. JC740]|uniref:FAD-binding oxidoreductase n=1 Tax=Rhodopirellula halodulae TaxID=2894198 RepID=A0ABS8NLM7_9BACT|nr:FAD-dependent oxidoreductase [Rhodopirellula sp. JC740]MCC9643837.1 FAD-binding oxidoreductase [Rhodopirellula sp. JC740]
MTDLSNSNASTDHVSTAPPTSCGSVVIGGGVIGLSVAWELVRRGETVTLLDRGDIAQGTSWAAAGILPPANFDRATDPIDRLRGYSHTLWPLWCQQLTEHTGINPGLMRCGGMYLAESIGEASALTGMMAYWNDLNLECERIDADELLRRQPQLSSWAETNPWIQKHPQSAGWWTPDEYQIRPPRLLAALAKQCQQRGVHMCPHSNVRDLHATDTGCELVVETSGGVASSIQCEQVVLCGGSAIGSIAPEVRLNTSVIPIRGQILLLHSQTFTDPIVLNIGNRYLVARGDGHVLVGSCEEEVGFELGTTPEVLEGLRHFANRVCQELSSAKEVASWSGHRPMTFDGFPMIGRIPDQERLLVAGGHYRSGIHLACGTAVAIADTVERRTSFMDLSSFSVGKQQAHLSV